MKKLNFTFLFTMLMSMVGLNASAHDIEVENADGVTIYYNFINNNTELAVTYRGSSYSSYSNKYTGNVVIPESVTHNEKTYRVTSIGNYAFDNCSGLTSVTIPNSVTSIGYYAFESCSGLTSITIPNSVTSIGERAFSGCSSLYSVTIPNSVMSIGYYAFYNCSGLQKVIVPDIAAWCGIEFGSVAANPLKYAHHLYSDDNTEITELLIPDGVTSIGQYAFSGWSVLPSVTIPNSVTSIGNYAFEYCSGLTSVTIPNSVTSIGYYAFESCSGLTSITIPNSVTSIGEYAFYGCSGLTSVTIGSGVTSIGNYAFDNCSGLQKVIVPDIAAWCGIEFGDNPLSYAHHLYSDDNTEITELVIPDGVTSIGLAAFQNCSGLTSLTIPNSVTSIGGYAFRGCSGLTSVTIGSGVTSIGDRAFQGCSGLTLVECNIGKAFNISSNTFSSDIYNNAELRVLRDLSSMYKQAEGWKNFKSITEGNVGVCGNNLTYTYSEASGKLTIQGTGAMYDYSSSSPAPWNSYKGDIITIVIEDGATSVGSYAFSGCNSLYSVTFGKDVKTVGSSAFSGCSNIKKVIALDNVTSIGSSTFSGCSGLTSFTIPNSVTSIGERAFYGCSGLTSITIPNSVTSIGSSAFSGCLGLTSVTIPNSVTSIRGYAFSGCSGLTSVTIPNSVTSIETYAFRNCSGLTSVTIGTGVTSIETYAFRNCSGLTSVTFHCNSVGTWFKGWSSIKEVWIEKEVTSIAPQSFAGCSGLQSVYNNAEDAFTIAKNTFDDATYSSATLYVPTGMKATYEETPWWLNFNKMEEYDFPTGITIPQQSKDVKVVDAYQINGLKTGSMQKGLNILKMSDGTTIKVMK